MNKNLDRFALGNVQTDSDGPIIIPNVSSLDLSFDDYSRFKYGDGRMSRRYGIAMARQVIGQLIEESNGNDIFVTSSAYKTARPASTSLMVPFVWTAQSIARVNDSPSRIVPFKINRANLTDGDYADMSAEERSVVMNANGLSLPADLDISDARVIALDDIRVTGSHEVSLDTLLRTYGADHVTHSYILDIPNGSSDPTLESRINSSAIASIDDIITLASIKQFMPNARLCKRILSEPTESIKKFSEAVPMNVLVKIIHDSLGDGLDLMDRYATGFETLRTSAIMRNAPNYVIMSINSDMESPHNVH